MPPPNDPGEFDLEIGLGGPGSSPPDPGQPPPAGEPATPPDDGMLRLRIKDEEYEVPKDEAQALADRMGWSLDDLAETLQIGRDGKNIYRNIAEERGRLRQGWEDLEQERRGTPASHAPQGGQGPAYPGGQPQSGFRPRPPSEDVTGQMLWLAEVMEQALPALSRLPTIEESVNRSAMTSEERERQAEINAERAQASSAYNDVAENWRKQGFQLPAQRVLEAELRKFPISDDLDLTWPEIWDRMGWMIGGAALVRQTRRRAVLEGSTPRTLAPMAPAHRASPGMPAAAPTPAVTNDGTPKTEEQLQAEFAAMSRTLQGVSAGDVAPHLSRR